MEKRSKEDLDRFLAYTAEKGLMPPATVASRRAAVSKVLGILDDTESGDVTSLDLDDVVLRFGHLHGQSYNPSSLATYKSRLKSAVEDFKSYLRNPLEFRPAGQSRTRVSRPTKPLTAAPHAGSGSTINVVAQEARQDAQRFPPDPMESTIFPIPIRADRKVFVQGIPFDLTEAEAKKIAAVITALVAIPS